MDPCGFLSLFSSALYIYSLQTADKSLCQIRRKKYLKWGGNTLSSFCGLVSFI